MIESRPPLAFPKIHKKRVDVLQFNLGRLCNQACRHCHIDAAPHRSDRKENATAELIEEVLELLARYPQLTTLDLTGGTPELNPGFRRLVRGARELGRTVFVRHNLTVQGEPNQEDLPDFFAEQGVTPFCSMPCYLGENVDQQRGPGVFERSIDGLRRLNAAGFGIPGGDLDLNLVYNPVGATLPPLQSGLEEDYRRELSTRYGVVFSRLFSITNQPIRRFRRELERQGQLEEYLAMLRESHNDQTLAELMCRSAISLRWDGRLYDCDFNLALDLPLRGPDGCPWTLRGLLDHARGTTSLQGLPIAVGPHCFACTAGCGSSCGGALA